MKRLSPLEKQRLVRHAGLKFQRRLRKKSKSTEIVYEPIQVPKFSNLEKNYEESMEFVNVLADRFLTKHEFIKIDFGNCEIISSDAVLVLAAEVDRCVSLRTYKGKAKLNGTYPHSASVCAFLNALGFYKLLSLKEPSSPTHPQEQSFMQMRTGVHDKGKTIGELAQPVFSDAVRLDDNARSALYRGLSEAMTNVTRHAYDPEFKHPLPVKSGQWWMAGYWNRDRHEIMAFMYDQGIGIPATFPKTHKDILDPVKKVLRLGKTDGELIEASMRLGESRSGARQHGKGMADLSRDL